MKNFKRGGTLIELLVACSCAAFVLISVLGIFSFASRQFGNQTGRAQTALIANQAMISISKDIRRSVSTGSDSSSNTYFVLPANTDAQGNYVPTVVSGVLTYAAGTAVEYHLSNTNGNSQGGTNLWRYTSTNGGTTWTSDTTWSRKIGVTPAVTSYSNVKNFRITTTGLPANTINVSLTLTDQEGGQTSTYTTSRNVYLSNHN